MITLLINQESTEGAVAVFGGMPLASPNKAFAWPKCNFCSSYMQYLGRVKQDGLWFQIFMCQHEPGVCGDWEADGGSNAVVVTPEQGSSPMKAAPEGETLRNTFHGAKQVAIEASNYNNALQQYVESNSKVGRQVLGQLGGTPFWLQANETPQCSLCNNDMKLLAQLEQGPDYKTEMNFGGGGCAYLFTCSCEPNGKFLWQC